MSGVLYKITTADGDESAPVPWATALGVVQRHNQNPWFWQHRPEWMPYRLEPVRL